MYSAQPSYCTLWNMLCKATYCPSDGLYMTVDIPFILMVWPDILIPRVSRIGCTLNASISHTSLHIGCRQTILTSRHNQGIR